MRTRTRTHTCVHTHVRPVCTCGRACMRVYVRTYVYPSIMYVWTCIHACGKLSNLLRRSGLKGLKRSMGFKACIGPSQGSGLGLSLGAVEKLSRTCLPICLSVLLREMYTYTYMYMQTYMYMCTYRYTVHVSLRVRTAACVCTPTRMYVRT